MVRKEDILDATNNGLDIIRHLYPDVERLISSGKMSDAFKIRPSERTPSAHLKLIGGDRKTWFVTDFGDDQHPRNPIDLVMKEQGLGFKEALVWICSELCLTIDTISEDINRPRYEKGLDATPDMKEGEWYFELNDEFTEKELQCMGPLVSQDHVSALHWHSVKWVGKCKDRKITKKYSTPTYPIFLRECFYDGGKKRFYKKYEPKCFDKAFRFMYIGQKPRDFINGLYELSLQWQGYNDTERYKFEKDPTKKEGAPYIEKKMEAAVICSGERDSLCARSLGYFPIWLNSETAELTEEQYKSILKYVENIYNIPDKDETGIRRGRILALRFPEIRTIWLPNRFERFNDDRGRKRKDFKDWLELQDNPYQAMKVLVGQALPSRFWEAKPSRKEESQWSVSSVCLQYFLRMQGFYKLKDRDAGRTDFVRLHGNIVERVTAQDISEFLINWARGEEPRYPGSGEPSPVQPTAIQNLIIDSPRTSPAALDKLSSIELDFTAYTPGSQMFFFSSSTVKVTADNVEEFDVKDASELGRFVWRENVIQHKLKLLPSPFEITATSDGDSDGSYDIKVLNTKSKVFSYLINSSRLYWQKELVDSLAGMQPAERQEYIDTHRFCIDGERLTELEVIEQKRCLLNKLFAIGYLLHGYKSPSRAWAPIAMDWKIDEDDKCNGRSGKSFLFTQLIPRFIRMVKLSGRNPKLLDNPHIFDQVNRHTGLVLFDDCQQNMRIEMLYDNITGDMTVNPKNNQSYNISFSESPKIGFTTNYIPNNFDASTMARLLPMVFSDFYHEKTEDSEYEHSWSIRDDFNKDIFGVDYSFEEFNADYNFVLRCVQFYLMASQHGAKLMPPMDNIMTRKRKQIMSGNFETWAETYFSPLGTHLDRCVIRAEALEDFRKFSGLKDMTTKGFTKKLKAFVKMCKYTKALNPPEICTTPPEPGKDNGRILKRPVDALGNPLPNSNPVDNIYIQTDPDVLIPLRREMEERERIANEGKIKAEEQPVNSQVPLWRDGDPF